MSRISKNQYIVIRQYYNTIFDRTYRYVLFYFCNVERYDFLHYPILSILGLLFLHSYLNNRYILDNLSIYSF